MREERFNCHITPSRPVRATVSALCLVLSLFASAANGQSGRRLPKGSPPAQVTPEPTPPEKSAPEKPRLGLTLGINGRDNFSNIPMYVYDAILDSCSERLGEAPSLRVSVAGRDMNRSEAVKLAKSQKEGVVVLLELGTNGADITRGNPSNYDEFTVNYYVFAPETGRTVASGRAYQRSYRTGGKIPGTGGRRTSSIYSEQLLRQAARDAADQIIKALHVSIQP